MKTAVLTDEWLYWKDGLDPFYHPEYFNASRLCEVALAHNLAVIWVCPGSKFSQQLQDNVKNFLDVGPEYDVRIPESYDFPYFGSIKRTSGKWDEKRIVYFGFPEHDSRWQNDDETWALADIEQPAQFLDQMTSLEAALMPRRVVSGMALERDWHVRYSPGYSGYDLMKEVWKLYGHTSWMREADLSMFPNHKEPGGFVWKRPLTLDDVGKQYIHFYDRNAQFPAAATGAECGEGTPEHVTNFNGKLPGVWRFTCLAQPDYNNLPRVVPEIAGWAYTPTIQAMQLLGYWVEIHEGYQWPIHHRALQDWAKHCWEARQSLNLPGPPSLRVATDGAYHMAKMIANRGLGFLEKDRPDWCNMVRSLARYRLVLKIKEYADKGFYPIMIVQDNIAYLSDDPNPFTAVPDLLKRRNELGGFKHDGTYLLRDVLPFLAELPPNQIRTEVKKLDSRVRGL